ncbi:hypothetical protein MCB86_01115 [Pseudomonas sp. KSR10]|nr:MULTISPECIES: hypothetical protein [Pseudomonadaceae]MCG6538675.1 hypothetical protein [Pseudomonas sp. KSR10]
MEPMIKKIASTLKAIIKHKFRATAILVILAFTLFGYWLIDLLIDGDYFTKYKELDPFAKELVSIEGWWLETLIGGCVPMFLVFGIQFYLLKFDLEPEKREFIFAALPFIPKLKWLTNKPIIFMLGTSSIFLGMVLYLGIEGNTKYLAALFIPALLFLFIYLLRISSSQISSGEGFSKFTHKKCVSIGWACIVLSFSCWVYADVILPFSDALKLWSELNKS